MSFYGQMRWGDFQKFFYNFHLTNKEFSADIFNADYTKNTGASPTIVGAGTIRYVQPNEDFATFHFNTANHWIKMCATDSQGDEGVTYTGLSIFHNSPKLTNLYSCPVIQVVDEEQVTAPITELTSGTCFKVTTLKYDQAGHQATLEQIVEDYFKIPVSKIQVNQDFLELNEKGYFHFINDDDWVKLTLSDTKMTLEFTHAKPEGFTGATIGAFAQEAEGTAVDEDAILEPGDKFSSYNITVDDAGHVTSLEKVYFQLPVDKIDEALTALTDRVTANEGKIEDHESRIGSIENANYGTKIANLQLLVYSDDNQIDNFRDAVAQLRGESVSEGSSARTIAAAIADSANHIRQTLATLDKEVKDMREEFLEKEETDEMAVMRNAIAKLDDRIAMIETQLGIS